MSISIPDFWKLVIESHLLTAQQCQQLGAGFGHVKGAAGQGTARTLAEWLVAEGALSRFQVAVLLSGHPGPFYYGEYKVYDRIEKGRFQGQFRAIHIPTNHLVLLQFLTGADAQDPQAWATLAAAAQHRFVHASPYLQRYFDLVDVGAFKFLVSEDFVGDTLAGRLATAGRLAPAEACATMREAALGLAHLHQLGSLHGDLRPQEIWLMEGGPAKLLHDPSRPIRPLSVCSHDPPEELALRADFAAPEFAHPQQTHNVLTDIYALGCTLYQSLTGTPPFNHGSAAEKLQRHAVEPIQPLEPLGVPQAVGQIVAYMMAKNAGLRFPQPQIVADQLAPFCDPARLFPRPIAALPTLAAYEAHVSWRWSAGLPFSLATPATATATATAPAPTSAIPRGRATTAAAVPSGRSAGPSISPGSGSRAPSATERMREGRKPSHRNVAILGGSTAAAAVVILILVIVVANSNNKPTALPVRQVESGNTNDGGPATLTTTANQGGTQAGGKSKPGPGGKATDGRGTAAVAAASDVAEQVVVVDDGALLWASPTSGSPIELDFVPLDSHFVLSLRVADLLASDEGPRFLQACGPALQAMIAQWEQGAGVRLGEIDQLIFTLHDNGDDWPRPAVVVRLRAPVPADQLAAKWGNPAATATKGGNLYQGGNWAYYVPDRQAGVFLMGTADDVKQVAEQQGVPPPLRRELGILRKLTDSQRQLTILATPNFLTTNLLRDGRAYYFGEALRLRKPLDWFLKDEIQAVLLSLHFGDDAYLEMRMIGTQGKDRFTLAKEVRERLSQVPDTMFEYIATLGSNPYWERVRLRYPNMISFLCSKTRIGADAETAAVNCRLPRSAAHNLAFGTEMVLVSTPGAATVAVANTGTDTGASSKPSPATMTIEDILFKHQTSISFEAQTLEFALEDIAKDVNESLKGLPFEFKIKILGRDLQLDGITQNQTVRDFMHKNKTVGDILTAMAMKANSPAAPDPSSPEQKLLWVIDKDPDDPSKPIVLITTRQMADKKKYTLPPPFKLR